MAKKLSKTEINKIMKKVPRQIYIGKETYREEFRQVIYNDIYFNYIISSFGRLFSIYYGYKKTDKINLKLMSPTVNRKGDNKGYYQALITDNDIKVIVRIHKLVSLAFIKNPKKYKIVNHKDGIKTHNYVWNLEWCTSSDNIKHAYDNRLCVQPKGENKSSHKYYNNDIINVCELLAQNVPVSKISKMTNIPKRMIRHILKKEVWTHITGNYDFSSYNGGRPLDYKNRIEEVCRLLELNKYTMKDISRKTGVTYAMVKNILNKEAHREISKKYKISNFNKYESNRKKYKVQRLSKG